MSGVLGHEVTGRALGTVSFVDITACRASVSHVSLLVEGRASAQLPLVEGKDFLFDEFHNFLYEGILFKAGFGIGHVLEALDVVVPQPVHAATHLGLVTQPLIKEQPYIVLALATGFIPVQRFFSG